jgi:hypothetical protein
VPEAELVALPVPEGLLLSEPLLLLEALAVLLLEALLLGLAPRVRELLGLLLTVELELRVLEGVGPAVPVAELLGVPVAEALGVAGGVELPERELLLDVEALAPGDRLEVALLLTVELALTVLEGDSAGVPVPLTVGEAVPVPLGELLLLALPERDSLLLTDALAPLLREAVGLPDRVELQLRVEEGVLEGVAVLLPV